MKSKQVLCKAKVRCINPATGKYTYPGEEATFTIGWDSRFKEIPKHFEAAPVNAVKDAPPEVETLLEMQIKGMTIGRIVQYMQIYYGVKIELGQAQETAVHQAIKYIRDPKIKRKPDSEIMAGLAAINNDTPDKNNEGPGTIPSGSPAAVVPAKNEGDDTENSGAGEKLFKDMTADDWDGIDRNDIISKVKRMYEVDMGNGGNKTVVINKALKIEAAALEAKLPV